MSNGKHIMSGSEVGTAGMGGLNSIANKITSQNYIAGNSEFRSRGDLEITSVNKMQMSAVSSGSSPRNLLSSNGKKYEMYYETKYQE